MDGNCNSNIRGRVRKRVAPTSRRVWTYAEEMELVSALNELVVKGKKCDNGFTSGYLLLLENMLALKFPGTDLKGDPHINSKIHVWKKQYACMRSMLTVSGIGLNSSTYHIDAFPEVWDAYIKVDSTARELKNKTFLLYQDWIEIFGNDHANGSDSQFFSDVVDEVNKRANNTRVNKVGAFEAGEALDPTEFSNSGFVSFNVGESSSATKDKGKGAKRKKLDVITLQFIDTIGNYCEKNENRFGQIADTMGNIAERIGSEFESCKKCG
ncbi:hypothetical protein ACS0TY_010690 [Phlomoides rotata]